MVNLVQELNESAAKSQADDAARYREILFRGDNPRPGDTKTLQKLCMSLFLEVSDVESDMEAIRRMRSAQGEVVEQAELDHLNSLQGEAGRALAGVRRGNSKAPRRVDRPACRCQRAL